MISACSTLRLAPSASGQVTGICGLYYLIVSSSGDHYHSMTDGDETVAVACNADRTLNVSYTDPNGVSTYTMLGVPHLIIICKIS